MFWLVVIVLIVILIILLLSKELKGSWVYQKDIVLIKVINSENYIMNTYI